MLVFVLEVGLEGGLFCFLLDIFLAFLMSLFRRIMSYAISLAGISILLMNEQVWFITGLIKTFKNSYICSSLGSKRHWLSKPPPSKSFAVYFSAQEAKIPMFL